jgi:hypothetical protein
MLEANVTDPNLQQRRSAARKTAFILLGIAALVYLGFVASYLVGKGV